jgi:hypothetical protein
VAGRIIKPKIIRKIYYKVTEVWCEYPFQSEVDYRFCMFFQKKKFKQITDLIMDSTTDKRKEEYFKKLN